MRALTLAEAKRFEWTDIPDAAPPARGEALVAVRAIGVCGTDVSGNAALPNGGSGIDVNNSSNNTIGGPTVASRFSIFTLVVSFPVCLVTEPRKKRSDAKWRTPAIGS